MNLSKKLSLALLIAGVGMAVGLPKQVIEVVNAASVTPTVVDPWQSGNAEFECSQIGTFQNALKIDNWDNTDKNGTYGNITILNSDGTYFDWSSNPNTVATVIVKGGNAANIFNYNPQQNSDTNLYSPLNDGGRRPAVSHVTFCWNNEEVCEETVSCPTGDACRVDQTLELDCGGTILCPGNAPEAEECPERCGQEASEVPDGQCGYTQCPATEECSDPNPHCDSRCLNDSMCTELGEGYICYHPEEGDPTQGEPGHCRLATNPTSEQCVAPESTPTPTPTPNNNVKAAFSTIDPSCDSNVITAMEKITVNNIDQSGIKVIFKYNGVEKISYTDLQGQALVAFDYTGDGFVDVYPDGFASEAHFVTKETNCSTPNNGQVLGTSTQGQVLGATTYAETGIAQDVMMSILGLAGAGMFTTGAVLHVKKKD
ncbi:MAG: hypothetical protein BroJett025_03560 [Patescibacteria group bacterium]|nr:MAG: hypothetical protein BroJett025_03560 [Patescibacteria group bacterium]